MVQIQFKVRIPVIVLSKRSRKQTSAYLYRLVICFQNKLFPSFANYITHEHNKICCHQPWKLNRFNNKCVATILPLKELWTVGWLAVLGLTAL